MKVRRPARSPIIPVVRSSVISASGYSASVPLNGAERLVAKGGYAKTVSNYNANRTTVMGRGKITIGGQAVKSIRFLFWNGYIQVGEKSGLNSLTHSCALEANGVTVQMKFSGASSKVFAPGDYAVTDPVYPAQFGLSSFAANSVLYHRNETTLASAAHFIPYSAAAHESFAGVRSWAANGAPSQLLNTGALVTPSSSSPTFGKTDSGTDNGFFSPVMIIGEWESTADISLYGMGDSILQRYNDDADDGTAGGAFVVRGTRSVGGRTIPFTNFARQGERASYWSGSSNSFRKYCMRFCTHVIDNMATNDVNAGQTKAQILTNKQAFWTDWLENAKGPKRIIHIPCGPLTASTDSWATLLNQTSSGGYVIGGVRDQLNADIAANIGAANYPNELIDVNLDWQSQVALNTDKFVVTGAANYPTSDGTHPSPALHALAGARVATAAASWSV